MKFEIGHPPPPPSKWVHLPSQSRLFWPLWLLESIGSAGTGPLSDPKFVPPENVFELSPERLLEQWQRAQLAMVANGDTPLYFSYVEHFCERSKQGDLLALLQLFMVAYGRRIYGLSESRRERFIAILQEFGLDHMESWLTLDEYAPVPPNHVAAARVLRDFALAAQMVAMKDKTAHGLSDEWWAYKAEIHPDVERLLLLQSLNGQACYDPGTDTIFPTNRSLLSVVRWTQGNSAFEQDAVDQALAAGALRWRSNKIA